MYTMAVKKLCGWLIGAVVCLHAALQVQLSVNVYSGWQLRDHKALLS